MSLPVLELLRITRGKIAKYYHRGCYTPSSTVLYGEVFCCSIGIDQKLNPASQTSLVRVGLKVKNNILSSALRTIGIIQLTRSSTYFGGCSD